MWNPFWMLLFRSQSLLSSRRTNPSWNKQTGLYVPEGTCDRKEVSRCISSTDKAGDKEVFITRFYIQAPRLYLSRRTSSSVNLFLGSSALLKHVWYFIQRVCEANVFNKRLQACWRLWWFRWRVSLITLVVNFALGFVMGFLQGEWTGEGVSATVGSNVENSVGGHE